MATRIYAIAINTFREAIRDRVLYGVVGAACAVLLFSLALGELALNEAHRVVLDVGLASISLFSVVTAVILGSSLLYKEIDKKTLYVILPKPIHRHEFLLGKYFGITLTVGTFVAMMGALHLWVAAVQMGAGAGTALGLSLGLLALLAAGLKKGRDRSLVVLLWSVVALGGAAGLAAAQGVPVGPVLASLVLAVGEVIVVAAVATLFSAFSTPFLTGLLTFGVWLVGREADSMITMKSEVFGSFVREVLHRLAEVVPNLHLFVPGYPTLIAKTDGGVFLYVLTSTGYAALYAALVLALASVIFSRRDFL